jgi:hypothetical protein
MNALAQLKPIWSDTAHHQILRFQPEFTPDIIRHAVWLYARFTLSCRDVEDLLAERGLDISYESVRRWFLKFGRLIAGNLRRSRPRPSARWHLDEMVIRIRDVDDENENSSGSSRLDQRNASCRSMPPSRTPSTSNAISFLALSSRRFGPKHLRSGGRVASQFDSDHDEFRPTAIVNVSMPRGVNS